MLRNVAVVVLNDFAPFEFGVICEVFGIDRSEEGLPVYDFAAKFLFTALTLGTGFKGGEVTPLFFIGSTLGNALAHLLPLPSSLLAGMGFVAVFAGAANTPIASTLMAVELFGAEAGAYAAIACVISYLFSGHAGIYQAQRIGRRNVSSTAIPRTRPGCLTAQSIPSVPPQSWPTMTTSARPIASNQASR